MKLTLLETLMKIFNETKFRFVFVLTFLIFLIVYFLSLGYLIYSPNFRDPISFLVVSDWQDKIFKERVSFVWEPIVTISISNLSIFIAVPNLLLGILLSTLVGLNFTVSFFSYSLPKICRINPSKTLPTILPSLLTGFACCAPTFIIALGSIAAGLTTFFIAVRPIFMPISILILLLSLFWSLNRIRGILQKFKLRQ